jgi:SAM-dependent methyltransferase
MTLILLLMASLLAQARPAAAGAASTAAPAGKNPERGRDQYRNPADLDAYIAAQEEPGRDRWQKPDQVLKALAIRSGQTICDIGAGPGYFALRAARLVGPRGRVFAVDVEPKILNALRARIETSGIENITPVLGLGGNPLLPAATCDLILIVDSYHHFQDRPRYLRRLVAALAPAGRVANIDFHKRATPLGPPMEHRLAREEFLRDAAAAALDVEQEPTFLENQYFVILHRRP